MTAAEINDEVKEYISNGGAKEDLFEDLNVITNTYPNASDYTKEEFWGIGNEISYDDKATGEFISEVTDCGSSGYEAAAAKYDVDWDHPAIAHLESVMYTLQDGEFNTRPGESIARLVYEYGDHTDIGKCLGAELFEDWSNY